MRQRDPISPKLFNATLERVFRNLNWANLDLDINGVCLNHLRFADIKDMQKVEVEAEKFVRNEVVKNEWNRRYLSSQRI